MFLRDKRGRIIAQLRFQEGTRLTGEQSNESNAELFRTMKFIPRNIMRVDVQYFGLGDQTFQPLNEFRRRTMDITAALADMEVEVEKASNEGKVKQPKMLFVGPAAAASPDDGVLTYSTIETLFDVANIPERSVVLFRDDQTPVLKCLCENEALFGIEMRVLSGLPDTDYSVDFESASWALEKVAYIPFLSELRLAADMEQQLAAQNSTTYDREKAAYTRKTGEVKEHRNFEVIQSAHVVAEGGDDEDVS